MTIVVNVRRADHDVYIGRPSPFGNPFALKNLHDLSERVEVIEKYRIWFLEKIAKEEGFRAQVEELRGKRLGCHCKPQLCHGDVIVAYLNGDFT